LGSDALAICSLATDRVDDSRHLHDAV
jgi:hypothetical protein